MSSKKRKRTSIYAYYIGDRFIDTGDKDYFFDKYGFTPKQIYRMMENEKSTGVRYDITRIMIKLEPFDDEGNPIE